MSPHPALPQNVDLGLIFCHILHIANNRGAKLYQASSFAQLQNATKKNKEELYLGYNSATVILRERSLNDVQLDRCATVDSIGLGAHVYYAVTSKTKYFGEASYKWGC